MRYHWGLGVGHTYTHHTECTHASVHWSANPLGDPNEGPDQEDRPLDDNEIDEDYEENESGGDLDGSDLEAESEEEDDDHCGTMFEIYGDSGPIDEYED